MNYNRHNFELEGQLLGSKVQLTCNLMDIGLAVLMDRRFNGQDLLTEWVPASSLACFLVLLYALLLLEAVLPLRSTE